MLQKEIFLKPFRFIYLTKFCKSKRKNSSVFYYLSKFFELDPSAIKRTIYC